MIFMDIKKRGRPKTVNRRTELLGVRLTPKELAKFEEARKLKGLSPADFARECIKEYSYIVELQHGVENKEESEEPEPNYEYDYYEENDDFEPN